MNSEHILTGNIICIFSRSLYIRSQSLALLGAFSILKETSYKLHHLKRPKKATKIFIFGNFCGLDHQIFINIHVHNNQLFLRQKLSVREPNLSTFNEKMSNYFDQFYTQIIE